MKKLIFAIAVVIFTTLAVTNTIQAQKINSSPLMEDAIASANEMSSDNNVNTISKDDVNQKALRHFERKFKTAKDAKWTTLKDGFMARFKDNDIIERVFYHANGNLAGTLKGYNADKMLEEIRSIIKGNYNGYAITYVDEAEVVNVPGTTAYIVHLRGVEDLKVVRVIDGEIDVLFDSEKNINNPKRF